MTKTETVESLFDSMRAEELSGFTYAEIAEHYSYNLPENARRFESLAELRKAVQESGSHYWDRDAIRFFRAKTHPAASSRDLLPADSGLSLGSTRTHTPASTSRANIKWHG